MPDGRRSGPTNGLRPVLLETCPGRALTVLARQHRESLNGVVLANSLPPPFVADSERTHLMGTVGKLWLAGVSIDWNAFHRRGATKP